MSLTTDNNGMVMPVGPMGNNGFGFGGDGSFIWIFALFYIFMFGMWGGGFGGYGGYGGGAAAPMLMNNNNDVQRGFDQQAVMSGIGQVQSGINSLAQGQCAGFAGVNQNINNGFFNAEIAANGRQLAGMQQNWNMQTAIDGRLDSLAMNQQSGICENRAAIADVKYAIAQDGAATRSNTDAKVQAVMDKLCQLELDGIKQNYENRIAGMQNTIDSLRTENANARFDASQVAQNALFQQGMNNEVDQLYNRLSNCPVPTTPVYGRTPIFTCNNGQNGCGCGYNQFAA